MELKCRLCGSGFLQTVSEAKRTKKDSICGSCAARQEELVSLTCMRCREDFDLRRVEAEALPAPFCPAC